LYASIQISLLFDENFIITCNAVNKVGSSSSAAVITSFISVSIKFWRASLQMPFLN